MNAAKSRIQEIDIAEYQRLRAAGEAHVLIDTRENDEWAAGHAAGAVHLGKGIIERDIETQVPRKDAKLVLYCGGGYRSALAADALAADGLHQRYLARWRMARLPGVRTAGREVMQGRDPDGALVTSARAWLSTDRARRPGRRFRGISPLA